MPDDALAALTWFSALGCGVVGGVFFAFSTFVMRALSRLPAAQGIAAMQSINVAVIRPMFMLAFLGTGAACLALALSALFRWERPGAAYALAGSLLYLFGTLVVTMVFNVPHNNALASVKPETAEGSALWARYVARWTLWNHLRTAAAIGAAALLTMAVCLQAAGGAVAAPGVPGR